MVNHTVELIYTTSLTNKQIEDESPIPKKTKNHHQQQQRQLLNQYIELIYQKSMYLFAATKI